MRLMQHKREAYWFYRFLSIFYDKIVNPLFWTVPMREKALEIGQLTDEHLRVVDVGAGTGFTTEGIVARVPARHVTCIDQSPHQLRHARRKPELQGCTFLEGDAENLPFETDHFDRYVSAGSIEYWPNPEKGIAEAYRVIKPGGWALMIGPLEPGSWFSRTLAQLWMLFPKEEEYREWFRRGGFEEVRIVYVAPHWHRSRTSRYGIALAGRKPKAGLPPNWEAVQVPDSQAPVTLGRRLQMWGRVLLGSLAGFVFIPIALLGSLWSALTGQKGPALNRQQITALVAVALFIVLLIWLL